MNAVPSLASPERLRRWRLLLGGAAADGVGCTLTGADLEIDRTLASLYDAGMEGGDDLAKTGQRKGGSGASQPGVARWLGDIRKYFPSTVVRVMQKDALERLKLHQLLLEPELLEAVEPDVHLVANLLALRGVIPAATRETARIVVRKVVDELMRRLQEPLRSAISGALNRAERNYRPRFAEMDWPRTIRANLRHYQADYQTIVPETRIGFGRKRQRTQRQVILCIDQSGSMAASVVYSSICGAVMASLPAVKTHLVVFDTAVVDLTEHLDDPVELLFGTQLGGGTDINAAVAYCQDLINDQDLRVEMSCHSKRKPHVHTTGIALYRCIDELFYSRKVNDLIEFALHFSFVHPQDRAVEKDIFPAGQFRMKTSSSFQ
mgnify:CR=1 FL=1